jgi:hypothetical protein
VSKLEIGRALDRPVRSSDRFGRVSPKEIHPRNGYVTLST